MLWKNTIKFVNFKLSNGEKIHTVFIFIDSHYILNRFEFYFCQGVSTSVFVFILLWKQTISVISFSVLLTVLTKILQNMPEKACNFFITKSWKKTARL